MAQQNLTRKMVMYGLLQKKTGFCTKWIPFRCQIQMDHPPARSLSTSEGELESGVPVRPLPAGPGGRAHGGLLGRDVGRHVQALLEGERHLDLLKRLSLSLGDEEEDEDDGGEADAGVHPVRTVAPHHVVHRGERLYDEEHLEVGETGSDAAEDGPHLGGENSAE